MSPKLAAAFPLRLYSQHAVRTLEVAKVGLLVEAGLVQAERVHDIDLGLLGVVDIVAALLGRSVGTSVEGLTTDSDLGAVGLVDNAVDLLEVVGVGDELVVGDDVLLSTRSVTVSNPSFACFHALGLRDCRTL